MTILDRYLLKEVVLHWLAVSLVLWLILVSNRLIGYLADAAAGELDAGFIFILLGLKSVGYLSVLLPFSLYIGALLALGRLYHDSEMAAMAACGIGTSRVYRPLLLFGAGLAAALLSLTLFIAPRTAAIGDEMKTRAAEYAELSSMVAGRFQEAQDGKLVLYVERISSDHEHLENIFVRAEHQGRPAIVTAQRAETGFDEASGLRYLYMEDGYRYQGFPGEADYEVMRFGRHGVRVESASAEGRKTKRNAVPTLDLWRSDDVEDIAELQWRLSLPLAAVVLMLLVVPLSHSTPRRGRFAKIMVAMLVLIIYYNLLGTAQVWLKRGVVPPELGLWWVHLLPVLLTVILLRRSVAGRA